MANKTKKFYRPGTLAEKGTKVSLKTQPYINNIIFNPKDPITSLHIQLAIIKEIINQYEYMMNIPGMFATLGGQEIPSIEIGKCKLLIDFLTMSPMEITLKEQQVNNDILNELELAHVEEHNG